WARLSNARSAELPKGISLKAGLLTPYARAQIDILTCFKISASGVDAWVWTRLQAVSAPGRRKAGPNRFLKQALRACPTCSHGLVNASPDRKSGRLFNQLLVHGVSPQLVTCRKDRVWYFDYVLGCRTCVRRAG